MIHSADSMAHMDGPTAKDFENRVAEALRLAGYRVSSEQLVGHAKVDLLAREIRFGAQHTIAVECKCHATPLRRDKVVSIWADWEPLIHRGLVDEVLIVAANGLAPSALAYVETRRGLQSQRLEDLLASSIRFDSYLQSLQDQYLQESDGLPCYYLQPNDIDGKDLEELILDWTQQAGPCDPIAVLGGYGLGKTSFALHLSCSLATARIADVNLRVPILIRLQELIGEQSLEGLLGKHFTATHDAPGYSFSKLLTLNRAGHLVVILDGFDEMRQLLTWREFRHNLRELNRLCVGDARVLILGRPTAFDNDAQQRLGLHGERTGPDGKTQKDPDWPDYHEVQLASFSESQCKNFLQTYLEHRRGAPLNEYEFDRLWSSVDSDALRDIARRPVQLRMLADILPSYPGNTDELDLVKLYDIFIDQLIDKLIEREGNKQSRLAFSAAERRLFLRRFAYWLWTAQPTDQVSIETLPDELIAPFAHQGDIEATRRDLVVGSPLERRPRERIRFPHRAFQEFLIAEELWERLQGALIADADSGPRERAVRIISEVQKAMSREVSDFMALLRSREDDVIVSKLLATFEGAVSSRVAQTVFVQSGTIDEIGSRSCGKDGAVTMSRWELLALAIWSEKHRSREPIHLVVKRFAETHADPVDQLLALYCGLLSKEQSPPLSRVIVGTLRRILAGQAEVEKIYAEQLREDASTAKKRASRQLHRERRQGRPKTRESQAEGASGPRALRPISRNIVVGGQIRTLQTARVGVCVGRARLIEVGDGKFDISGDAVLQVRWLPDWGAELLGGLRFQRDGVLGFQGLGFSFLPSAGARRVRHRLERNNKTRRPIAVCP